MMNFYISLLSLCLGTSLALVRGEDEDMKDISGTVYVNNLFNLYINGEQVAADPSIDHHAVNVSFRVKRGKNITFAIDSRDWINEGGLEFDGRCIGSGWIRAFFSNGVVTNSSWVCSTYSYGPVNWKECFGAQMVRNQSLQLIPACTNDTVPPLEGCVLRNSTRPEGWMMPGFDDSRWEYALEYQESSVGYGRPPPGCDNPNAYISSKVDQNGANYTCQANINWGDSKFIWRPDLDLDNYVLCRYTLKLEAESRATVDKLMSTTIIGIILSISVRLTF